MAPSGTAGQLVAALLLLPSLEPGEPTVAPDLLSLRIAPRLTQEQSWELDK